MKLHENGAYLIQGKDIIINSPEAAAAVLDRTGKNLTPEEAKNHKPKVVFVDGENHIARVTNYEKHGQLSE